MGGTEELNNFIYSLDFKLHEGQSANTLGIYFTLSQKSILGNLNFLYPICLEKNFMKELTNPFNLISGPMCVSTQKGPMLS
jgi:hypothetical protein